MLVYLKRVWIGKGYIISSNDNAICYSVSDDQPINGVAIVINKNFRNKMTGYKPVNDRIITVSMSGQTEYNTDLCSDERNWSGMYGRFLCSLWRNNDEDPSREITVIAGDFYAKIGDTTQDDDLWNIVGKSGLGKRNNRGEHLLQFGASI